MKEKTDFTYLTNVFLLQSLSVHYWTKPSFYVFHLDLFSLIDIILTAFWMLFVHLTEG